MSSSAHRPPSATSSAPSWLSALRSALFSSAAQQDSDLQQAIPHAARTGYVYPKATLHLPSCITVQQQLTAEQRAELVDRVRGCVIGQAIGDAVGLPTEFVSKAQCAAVWPAGRIELSRACRGWAAGDWTDDTDQLVLILDGLIANGGAVDALDFARRLKVWCWNGFTELGDCGGQGIGNTVGSVVEMAEFETAPHACALEVNRRMKGRAASNGAVMRTSVLGIVGFEDLQRVLDNTADIASTTHADPRCLASACVCTAVIALTLQNAQLPAAQRLSPDAIVQQAIDLAVSRYFSSASSPDAVELVAHCTAGSLEQLQLSEGKGIGYTYKCIGSGVWAYRQQQRGRDFRSVLTEVAMEGGDADTNGAVSGAMLGCAIGYAALTAEWKAALLHRDWLGNKVNDLLMLMGLS